MWHCHESRKSRCGAQSHAGRRECQYWRSCVSRQASVFQSRLWVDLKHEELSDVKNKNCMTHLMTKRWDDDFESNWANQTQLIWDGNRWSCNCGTSYTLSWSFVATTTVITHWEGTSCWQKGVPSSYFICCSNPVVHNENIRNFSRPGLVHFSDVRESNHVCKRKSGLNFIL